MLSLAQHHFSPAFGQMPSSPFLDPPRSCGNQRIQSSGLAPLDTSVSQYSSQTASPRSATSQRSIGPMTKSPARNRPQPYGKRNSLKSQGCNSGTDSGPESKASGLVRRRISRACDQCNQLRTKCDGANPCSHCVEFGLSCEYLRERKKRGKASRKDIAAQQAATAANCSSTGSPSYSSEDLSSVPRSRSKSEFVKSTHSAPIKGRSASDGTTVPPNIVVSHDMARTNSIHLIPEHHQFSSGHPSPHLGQIQEGMQMTEFSYPDYDRQPIPMQLHASSHDFTGQLHGIPTQLDTPSSYGYPDPSMQMMTPPEPSAGFPFPARMDSPMNNWGASPEVSPTSWMALPSPSIGSYGSQGPVNHTPNLRFPVLHPILSKLSNVLPTAVACDLLELYFSSTTSAYLRPASPYLLGFMFRKNSFLHPTHPRKCSPALLASMLWVAAQTSDAPFLTSPPSARGRICQKLLELTVSLLQPLIHDGGDETSAFGSEYEMDSAALGGLGIANAAGQLTSATGGAGTVDDVATYVHLATVVSASEHKAASMRWWTMAFTLARELKLGRELPAFQARQNHGDDEDADGDLDVDMDHAAQGLDFGSGYGSSTASSPSEEEREERRRVWWLLYTVDRHLALCYNRPLFLLDAECTDLLQPVNDSFWQSGEYYAGNTHGMQYPRHRGPTYECTSHSIFGFFTPLMTILGEIVELQQARNHPTFGLGFFTAQEGEHRVTEIITHLNAYERSLNEFAARSTGRTSDAGNAAAAGSPNTAMTETLIQTRTTVAYGTHVLHVLHILLTGKWDPIALLDDSDLWISTPAFVSATQHAVLGAEALAPMLELDPELRFMPFFFGIYLLQGSFLLLLIADKLRDQASSAVVGACEVVVHAVEACIATLSTEYQRNFRKVMRSALAQVKGRLPDDFGAEQLRRREVLALYRWTGDGTGLAL